jgi:hypothetical protein
MLEKRIRDLLLDARANARKQNLEAELTSTASGRA